MLTKESRPQGGQPGRRYWIKTLRVRADEAGQGALDYLLTTLRNTFAVDDTRRGRAEGINAASVYLVTGTIRSAAENNCYWIDEEAHLDIAAALRRRDALRQDVQRHDRGSQDHYVISQLAIRATEGSDISLGHLIQGLEAIGEDRRRRSELDELLSESRTSEQN